MAGCLAYAGVWPRRAFGPTRAQLVGSIADVTLDIVFAIAVTQQQHRKARSRETTAQPPWLQVARRPFTTSRSVRLPASGLSVLLLTTCSISQARARA
ncbi:MAG TPA: hypothetical protein VHX17_02780 [Candidatus Cybelea sp.]|nr:hypothetical protein [Candidatus Cybelea sp.]